MRTILIDICALAIGGWLLYHAIVAVVVGHADMIDAVLAWM